MVHSNQLLQNCYRIIKVQGRGDMGAVYDARHIKLETVYVVKEMLPQDNIELDDVMAR